MDIDKILQTTRGFMLSRVILSAADLDLFTIIGTEPTTAEEINEAVNCDLRGLTILLDALASLQIIDKKRDRYSLDEDTYRALSSQSSGSVLPMIQHIAHIWDLWHHLTPIVQGNPPEDHGKLDWSPKNMKAFIGAMHVVSRDLAPSVIEKIDAGNAKKLLDVGGASGTYTIAFLNAHPHMKATIFDRPEVIPMSKMRISSEDLTKLVEFAEGSFYTDELPGGHDLAFLSAIIHQNSPEQNLELYGKVFRALVPGGRIVIRDFVMQPNRIHPAPGAMFAVNMLAATAGGGTYTLEEITSGLKQAGFKNSRLIHMGDGMDGLVEGKKP